MEQASALPADAEHLDRQALGRGQPLLDDHGQQQGGLPVRLEPRVQARTAATALRVRGTPVPTTSCGVPRRVWRMSMPLGTPYPRAARHRDPDPLEDS